MRATTATITGGSPTETTATQPYLPGFEPKAGVRQINHERLKTELARLGAEGEREWTALKGKWAADRAERPPAGSLPVLRGGPPRGTRTPSTTVGPVPVMEHTGGRPRATALVAGFGDSSVLSLKLEPAGWGRVRWTVKGWKPDGTPGYLHGVCESLGAAVLTASECVEKGDWRTDRYPR